MDKLSFGIASFVVLFVFASARSPLESPENDVSASEFVAKRTILLPSEKPESEARTSAESELESTDAKPAEFVTVSLQQEDDLPQMVVAPTELTGPLTVVTFRPADYRFHRRPFLFRSHHRCRHNFGDRRDIPYGNDAILSGGEDLAVDPKFAGDEIREIPARWNRFHHRPRPRFAFGSRMEEFEGRRHRHHGHGEDREDVGENRREDAGFLNRFRKFLGHF